MSDSFIVNTKLRDPLFSRYLDEQHKSASKDSKEQTQKSCQSSIQIENAFTRTTTPPVFNDSRQQMHIIQNRRYPVAKHKTIAAPKGSHAGRFIKRLQREHKKFGRARSSGDTIEHVQTTLYPPQILAPPTFQTQTSNRQHLVRQSVPTPLKSHDLTNQNLLCSCPHPPEPLNFPSSTLVAPISENLRFSTNFSLSSVPYRSLSPATYQSIHRKQSKLNPSFQQPQVNITHEQQQQPQRRKPFVRKTTNQDIRTLLNTVYQPPPQKTRQVVIDNPLIKRKSLRNINLNEKSHFLISRLNSLLNYVSKKMNNDQTKNKECTMKDILNQRIYHAVVNDHHTTIDEDESIENSTINSKLTDDRVKDSNYDPMLLRHIQDQTRSISSNTELTESLQDNVPFYPFFSLDESNPKLIRRRSSSVAMNNDSFQRQQNLQPQYLQDNTSLFIHPSDQSLVRPQPLFSFPQKSSLTMTGEIEQTSQTPSFSSIFQPIRPAPLSDQQSQQRRHQQPPSMMNKSFNEPKAT
ncbi:unnamed protein product, partial [Didymodactylos carnosus]